MKAERLRITERVRIDVNGITKQIIDDLIERGYFKDQQMVVAAAIEALQAKLADETFSDEYYDEKSQADMDSLQLEVII